MHLLSATFLARHQFKLLLVVVWLHVSVLDLFYITYNGPVFLWQDNSQLLTLVVHFSIALATAGLFKIISTARVNKSQGLGE
ncbi:MAG: hypothetical protein JKX90_02800 [Colwellia sp.]|nr:hypothetical protein [Colwellia sp.]